MAQNSDESAVLDPELLGILKGVIDPELRENIVDLGMVKKAYVNTDGVAHITVALTTAGCPLRSQIKTDVQRKASHLEKVDTVKVTFGELNIEEKRTLMDRARKNARENSKETAVSSNTRVLAIASGKGGVGKSSLTANLASSIADIGFKVGVLDADIWGFSQGKMLGVGGRLEGEDGKINPHIKPIGNNDGELKVVSMGFLIDDEQSALMWRGPILAKAVEQFLVDVQMAVSRLIPQSEMLIVTTPAPGASQVAARVGDMAQRSYMPIIGIVENMSYFVDSLGVKQYIFGKGGGEKLAKRLATQLVAQIPIDGDVSQSNFEGTPLSLSGTSITAEEIRKLAKKIVEDLCPPVEIAGCTAIFAEIFKRSI